jgi:dihydropteroate synthase
MSELTDYADVTGDVIRYFETFSVKADSFGIRDWVIDPGFGFAKTLDQNYELLRNLDCFRESFGNRRILVGVSRKSMIYKYLGISPEESLPATQVLHLAALSRGADILRVHDSAEASRTVSLYRQLG